MYHLIKVIVCSLVLAGCSLPDDDEDIVAEVEADQTPKETVLITDPTENAFTIQMPKGWQNMAYTARAFDISHTVFQSASPDGSTVFFSGDPSLPIYATPANAQVQSFRRTAMVNPLIQVAPMPTAEAFAPDYVRRKFGSLDGFEIVETKPAPAVLANLQEQVRKSGLPMEVQVCGVLFKFTEGGKTMNTILYGFVLSQPSIQMWNPGIGGIACTGDPEKLQPALQAMVDSIKVNPEWTALQKAKQEQRLAEIRERGRQNMQWLQDSARRHQARMDAIHAQGDASMRAYYERSAASDVQHRNFLNYINDETTVVNSSGQQFQVSNSYQRYFMNKQTGSYVGGDSTMDLDSLRKLGLNPDDYEEVKIKKGGE